MEILKSSTLNKITKYWYVAILTMLVLGIGYSYFVFTTEATNDMNNFKAIQIIIPILIITLVVIIMHKKRIKIQTKKDNEWSLDTNQNPKNTNRVLKRHLVQKQTKFF